MNGGPKENENPTVLEIQETSSPRHRKSIQVWSDLNSLNSDCVATESDDTPWQSSTNRSILKALQDVSVATDRRGVSLLLNSGLIVPPVSGDQRKKFGYPFPMPLTLTLVESAKSLKKLNIQIERDAIDEEEIFDKIRNIQDPEHPLTLEQLGVVSRNQITVQDVPYLQGFSKVDVRFTPTIPHCSMATLIGLSIRVKLLRSLPTNDRFKVTVRIEPGTHNSETSVNKQLADKERVCAALENKHLLSVVNKCIASGMRS
jgi:metal-sulfur cluster biosynthetic enzyme